MADSPRSQRNFDNPDVAHEPSDASFRGVVWFGVGLIVLAVVMHAALYLMFRGWLRAAKNRQPEVSPLAAEDRGRLPPSPTLEVFEPAERRAARKASVTRPPDGYAWVDRERGLVQIPVDEAMRLALPKLPSRPAAAESSERPSDANSGRTPPRPKQEERK